MALTSASIKKMWNDNGIGSIIALIVGLYVVYQLYKYFSSRGGFGSPEKLSANTNAAYASSSTPKPASASDLGGQPNGQFVSAKGITTSTYALPAGPTHTSIQDPSELLPRDVNGQWSSLAPNGKGMLADVNLLKAGALHGIDTIGSTLRNANLQVRSEPPNPSNPPGPWNLPTIEPDFMQRPFEVGTVGAGAR